MTDEEYKLQLKLLHKSSDRHVVCFETDMSESDIQRVLHFSNKVRKASNELTGIMNKNYHQLMRTKKYRKTLVLYGSARDKKNKKLMKQYANKLNEMQKEHNVIKEFCRKQMIHIAKKYGVDAVFGVTEFENVWSGVESCLYNNGKTLCFKKYDNLPLLRAKQINRGIIFLTEDEVLKFKFNKLKFGIKIKDKFQSDEAKAILDYLQHSKQIDNYAVARFMNDGTCIDTYRPCYATLVPKFIRGKYRMYIHITVEGKAVPKYNKDGTIKKGKKRWKYSNHYKKIRAKYKDLCRKNAINRHLAINEDVNHLRSLGDVFITEPKNASKLQKRAKKTTVNKNGRINRKKRFGKSIQNRCPGYFQAAIERKFKSTGGKYIEVPNNYRASQYDHTADEYIKKKLSQRTYYLKDGIFVQRDLYSAFLLFAYSFITEAVDREKCINNFSNFLEKQNALIQKIKANKLKILNSGIAVK